MSEKQETLQFNNKLHDTDESSKQDSEENGKVELGNEEEEIVGHFCKEELQEMLHSDGVGGDKDFLVDIINMASQLTKERMEEIDKAIKEGNEEATWRAAHSLKSTCLMSNMLTLGKAAMDLERAYRHPTNDDIAQRGAFLKETKLQAERLYRTNEMFEKQ